MTLSIYVNGAKGKMGKAVIDAINQDPELTLVGAGDADTDLADALRATHAQVAVDFTVPSAVFANAKTMINAGVHPVIGTTGLTIEQITQLQKLAAEKQLGGLIAPNFSLGMVLMMHCAQLIGRYLPDVSIIEMHHPKKLDAPAGTAKKTAEMIAQSRGKPLQHNTEPNPSLGLDYSGIPIHAIRLPGLIASQEIIFGGEAETLSLCHNTLDRTTYMPGVVMACKKVSGLKELVYGLENLLELN